MHSLSGVAWRGVVWCSVASRGVALALRFIAGVPEAFVARVFWLGCGVLAQGLFGQFLQSAAPLHIRRSPAHGLVALAWLSIRSSGVRVLSSFSFEFPFVRCLGSDLFGSFRLDTLAVVFVSSAVVRVLCFLGSTRVGHGFASLN